MPISEYDVRENATPREYTFHEWEVEIFDKQAALQTRLKELEIAAQKQEAQFAAWLRLPFVIITLPVRILFVVPLIVYTVRDREVPQELWNLLK